MKERSTRRSALGAPPQYPRCLERGTHLQDSGRDPSNCPAGARRRRASSACLAPPRPAPPRRASKRLRGNRALRSRNSQWVVPGRLLSLPLRSPGRALALDGPRSMDTQIPFSADLRACSPALPKGIPFTAGRPSRTLVARGRGWGLLLAAENKIWGRRAPPQAEPRQCLDIRGS